ncbi:hypothetical protein [Dactylosporangium sp. NPDC048998]|uniref:hypothetical protein n=1 Tax=Dactylosporangium sp. NPDC048998 TaxID=3363976 RepID=UPI00371ACA43
MPQDARHDFDFLRGTWQATNRSLRKRLVGSDEWNEFPSTLRSTPLLDGVMNVDELTIPGRDGGVTLRVFHPDTDEWSVYWAAAGARTVDTPVVGKFRDGVGEFYSDDTWEGTPVRVLYKWDARDPENPRWEQAFSVDGGETWETNWIASFTRVSP